MKFARLSLLVCLTADAVAMTAYSQTINNVAYSLNVRAARPLEGKEDSDSLFPQQGNPNPVVADSTRTVTVGGNSATVQVHASARSGAIGVKSSGVASTDRDGNATFFGFAKAQWSDRVDIILPGSTEFLARIIVKGVLNVHGKMDVSDGQSGQVVLEITEPGITFGVPPTLPPSPHRNVGKDVWGLVQKNPFGLSIVLLPPAQIPVSLDFFLGTLSETHVFGSRPLGYEFRVQALGRTEAGGTVVSEGDFANTLTWGGITSVETLSGEPITDYKITSASGFDYTRSFENQVPEPSCLALLGTALSALLAQRWAQRRKRKPPLALRR